MVAEFDTKAETGYKIYDENGIMLYWISTYDNIKHPHATHKLEEHQKYAGGNEKGNLNAT